MFYRKSLTTVDTYLNGIVVSNLRRNYTCGDGVYRDLNRVWRASVNSILKLT